MPTIGSCWAPNTWDEDAWAPNTWEGDVTVVPAVPSPTRLQVVDPQGTTLEPLDQDGNPMATPLYITAGETGDLALRLVGADGAVQDLTGATCTLRLVNVNGTVYANAVSLTISTPETGGVAVWNRLLAEVQDPGDYKYQVKATLAGGQPKYFPDAMALPGNPLTILPVV